MTGAQAEKAQRAEEARRAWDELAGLHRVKFPDAAKPELFAGEPVPMFSVLMRNAERRHLAGTSRGDRPGREAARKRAREDAEREALVLLDAGLRERDARRRQQDSAWASLAEGQPEALERALTEVLTTRGLNAGVTSDRQGFANLDVVLPGAELLPTHWPSTTSKGLPTLKKLNKTELAEQVRLLVAARVLLAVKESLAQSAGLTQVRFTGRRPDGKAILRADISRAAVDTAPWDRDAWSVLEASSENLETNIGGRVNELRPLS